MISKKRILQSILFIVISITTLHAQPVKHEAKLKWTASVPNSGERVKYYQVYRNRTNCDGPWNKDGRSKVTTFTDTTVKANQKYYFHVTMVDTRDIESGPSNCFTTTIP